MKRYTGKRQSNKYSFWKDAFCFVCFVWALFLVYILFMHVSEYKVKEMQANEAEKENVQVSVESGRLPNDDVPAYGYASLSAYLADGNKIEEEKPAYKHSAVFKVTYYCGCSKCCGKWSGNSESNAVGAAGVELIPYRSIAVDTNIISLGTTLYDSEGNKYMAQDTGSAIKGNRIDLFTGNHQEALNLGVSEMVLYW